MNYFASLLLAAGLPTAFSPSPSTPIVAPVPPVIQTSLIAERWGTIGTVRQAYQTIRWNAAATTTVSPAAHVNQGTAVPSTVAPSSPTPPSAPTAAAAPSSSSGSTGAATPSATTSGNTAMAMVSLINQAREQVGLHPYTVNATLMNLAQERAVALAAGPFTSDLPGYGWPVQMEQAAGIQAQGMGAENIAEANSVSQAFALLMASPPHRSNILNPNETQIGVGVAPWGSGVAISELFIGPNS